MKKYALTALSLALGLSTAALAANENNIVVSGTVPGYVTIHPTQTNGLIRAAYAPTTQKLVQFQHVILSSSAKKYLADHVSKPHFAAAVAVANSTPAQADLAMNGVPVLDQGQHGTCVTFATTAALDAALGHTDYISQLCNLELGATLAKQDSNYPSGWDGSTNEIVLSQIQKYGIITQDFMKTKGCAKVKAYPLLSEKNTGHAMKTDDFLKNSQKIMDSLSWKTWLEYNDALSTRANMDEVLQDVKQSITNNHRIIFATLIDENAAQNGADGNYKVGNDSWVLTAKIADDAKNSKIDAGHALVITGFDDNAVVKDSSGVEHKGVLTIRNSWGAEAGYQGTYYMSYDYFLTLAVEVKELVPNA